jgi:hypothetical protein
MKAILEEKGAKNKIPVFGILERNEKVKIEIVRMYLLKHCESIPKFL